MLRPIARTGPDARCSSQADGSSARPACSLADGRRPEAAARRRAGSSIVDAGMTDLLRPALYGAWHGIEPVARARAPAPRPTSSGRSARRPTRSAATATLPPVEVGDLVAIRDTGAYGAVMASNYNRRPIAAEVMVEGDTLATHSAPPDDRRDAAVGRVMLIAFEGLDQSGKETQARQLRARLEQDGRNVRSLSFPDYGTPIGQRDPAGARRRTRLRPDVMQLLYVANRFEHRPRLDCTGSAPATSSSAIATARRAWRTARRRASTPAGSTTSSGICRSRPSPCCSTSRPETAVGAQAEQAAIGTSATWRCSRACARATAARPRRLAGSSSTPSSRARAVRRGGGWRPCCHGSRHRQRPHLAQPLPPATPAHASTVAPVVITSSTRTTTRRAVTRGRARVGATRGARRRTRRARCDRRSSAGRPACGGPRARRRSTRQTGSPSARRQVIGLIEAPRDSAQRMERHRHDGRRRQRATSAPADRARRASRHASCRRRPVLELVNELAQDAVVQTRTAARDRERPRCLAVHRSTRQRSSGPPRSARRSVSTKAGEPAARRRRHPGQTGSASGRCSARRNRRTLAPGTGADKSRWRNGRPIPMLHPVARLQYWQTAERRPRRAWRSGAARQRPDERRSSGIAIDAARPGFRPARRHPRDARGHRTRACDGVKTCTTKSK